MKQILIAAALVFGMNVHAATEDLDELLNQIKADISAQRLAKPAGNNALERIDAFRSQAPFDFRITPLIFKFGESYVALANKAMANKEYGQAQGYLDIAWQVSALAPGLEAAQEKNDRLSGGKANAQRVAANVPSAAELKEQKALAVAAIAEKKRLDKERINKVRADKQAKADTAKRAAANKKAKQEAERERRLANVELDKQKAQAQKNKSQKDNLQKKLASATAEKARLQSLAQQKSKISAPMKAQVYTQNIRSAVPIRIAEETRIGKGVETSSAIASYPLPQDKISNRDRGISQDLVPICKAILDEDASIVLHTDSKGDYRWLTVRLTLCTRRLDPSFRLRHSFDNETTNESFITLHPARSSALLGDG
ncbi:MAG: colicin import membrane protein [Marinomonas primoryensis]|jgi:colicin import membrane protein